MKKHAVEGKWIAVVFFCITLCCLGLIAIGEFGGTAGISHSVRLTEGQRETARRAKIIRKVLEEGELKLSPSKHYRVVEDTEK